MVLLPVLVLMLYPRLLLLGLPLAPEGQVRTCRRRSPAKAAIGLGGV